MKKVFKKIISTALATTMVLGSMTFAPATTFAAATFTKHGGWNETIYAELSGISDSDVTAVSYNGTVSGSLTGEDLEYLVRDCSAGVRIDIPGVPAGTYSLSVTANGSIVRKDNIVVKAQDRSGFAHFNYTAGVGAYNDDGTLKNNAKVLYVTNANKNSVTVSSSDGTTVTGIGNILNSSGGKIKTGAAATTLCNTNQDIIRKLAADGTPLVVRLIGNVSAPDGLTAYDSNDYGGTEGDNGFMARMQSGKDITIEGIGYDAVVDGWGFHFIAQSAYPDYGKSFEVRNIKFKNVPEDCVGMEGVQEGSKLTASVERCWVHNCDFYAPSIANPAESDKDGGDGACDFKRGQYFTNSYCYYEGYHKTNLVGASDSNLQFNITYHHNYWKNCESRGPLARMANIHMYNNVFEGQTSYAMNTRANAYIFSEYNLLYQCKNPMRVDGGAIKSYNDSLSGCIEEMGGTVVTDKSQKVSSGNTYENFDTSSSLSYIPSGNYQLQESISEAKKVVYAESGTMDENPVSPEEVNTSMILVDRQPTASVQLPYDQALNSSYLTAKSEVKDNIIFNAYKLATDSISIGSNETGQDIVFNVNTAVNITITDGGATYPVILMSADGAEVLTGSGTAYNVPAGTYFIQSSGFQPAKSNSPAKFKEAKITSLKIEAYDSSATTVTEPTTQTTTTTQTTEVTETTTSAPSGGDEPTEETTSAPYQGEGLVWNHTDGTNTLNATVDCNDWADAVAVTYNGSTFTSAVKMESGSNISFTVPGSGNLTLVTYSSKNPASVNVNGETVTVSQNGATTIPVSAGTVTIEKGTASTYLYLIEFTSANSEESTETTTETTTQAPDPTPSDVVGDSNGNGIVEKADIQIVLDYAAGKTSSVAKADLADVNGDGKVTAYDAYLIGKIILK